MGLLAEKGRWYFVRRVPRRFAHLDRRAIVRIALRTDSEREARLKAPSVEAQLESYWEALAAGQADAPAQYVAAVKLAQARGFAYRPVAEIAAGDLSDMIARLESLVRAGSLADHVEISAVLGAVEPPRVTLSAALDDFFALTRDRVKGKAEGQVKRWKDVRRKTIGNLIALVGDKPLAEITRADALVFRKWWQDQVEAGHAPNTANKQFGQASDIFQTVNDLNQLGLENPFGKLRLQDPGHEKRAPFAVEWIRDRILAPGALDGLNVEARDVLIAMVNTGAGPNEIIGLASEDFRLDHDVPHIRIQPNEFRHLKTAERPRDIPALGVSLAALRRLAEAGGCLSYRGRNDVWSATVNKFLRSKGLLPTDRHTAYSLRHSFEDRLLDAGTDDRIRADLMGHAYARPKYGSGGRLPKVLAEIEKIVSGVWGPPSSQPDELRRRSCREAGRAFRNVCYGCVSQIAGCGDPRVGTSLLAG